MLGGREGGFVNRLIGAIFASLVCHSTFTRCVTKSRFPDIGSPGGPGAISREVGTAWATGLWSPVTGLGQRGICGGGGTQMAAAPGVLRFDDLVENKQREGRSEGSLGLLAGGCSTWIREDVCEKDS